MHYGAQNVLDDKIPNLATNEVRSHYEALIAEFFSEGEVGGKIVTKRQFFLNVGKKLANKIMEKIKSKVHHYEFFTKLLSGV